ncbi:serine hydrolase domain-containing protein [Shouchella patagoniensis]|uniref:serine hydrolase domain-containing protein n=1 Tax=Shouchella patagoniensis TaxID=228576 RepID=UPI000994CAEC|nr:serine hydrolase domain-containing protein [Shouchella patagoniensis]
MKIVLRTFIIINILLFPLFPHIATAQLSKEEQITQLVERFMTERNIPGVSIALLKEDSLFYANAWGVTGGEQKPVELDTPFLLGSISKSLTGLAIAVLIDDGALDLDDSVTTLIPWLTFEDKKANAITISDLLSQTSGFGSYDGYKLSDRGLNDKEAIRLMAHEVSTLKLTVAPGEIHQYSNANYILLGALIEEIAGQPYSNFMQERIFTPLAMDNAAADKQSAYSNALPSGYESWFGQAYPGPDMYDNSGAPYGYIAASANDMMAYLSLLSGYNDDFFIDHTSAKAV